MTVCTHQRISRLLTGQASLLFIALWFNLTPLAWATPNASSASRSPQNTPTATSSIISLTVLPGDETHPPSITPERYDFGQRRASETTPIEHSFVLRNDGQTPLTLDRLQPSCGCTTALVGDGTKGVSETSIAPGQQIQIHTAVDPRRLSPGPIDKFVYVFVQGQSHAAAVLEITGTLQGGVTFSRTSLNFGRCQAGGSAVLTLTVTLDKLLLPTGAMPRLVSSNPDVVVEKQKEDAEPPATGEETYAIRLAPHPRLGVLTGVLSVVTGDGAQAQMLSPVSLPIMGDICGDVTATPQAIAFGMVIAGAKAVQRLRLTAASEPVLRGIRLSCASRFVTVRVVTQPVQGSIHPLANQPAFLEATLSPNTPIGTMETQVLVTTPSGEQLTLPVYAYVVRTDHLQ